jgi:hypothetical protein
VPEATIRDYYYHERLKDALKVELACRRLPVTELVEEPAPNSPPVDLTEPSWIAAQKRGGISALPCVVFGPDGERVQER